MTVRTSSASSCWDSTVKSTRSENRTVTSLRCSATARSTSSSRWARSGCEGSVDDRVAEHGPLRFERGDGVVDRRQVRHGPEINGETSRLLGRVPRWPNA